MESRHQSVLAEEVMEGLMMRPDDVAVDATVGGAGHFSALLGALGEGGVLIGIDADHRALERARDSVAADRRPLRPQVHIVEDNFRNLDHVLARLGIEEISKALFDLGWSGFQLADGRGFSFREDEPLLMTYGNPEAGKTAADIVNSTTERELADLIHGYGEERFSRGIARSIVLARKKKRITSTVELVAAIERGVPARYRTGRIHPATKTFQALRIATNDEFGAIAEGLAAAVARLSAGGRIAVITFHSIEDRLVKRIFRAAEAEGKGSAGRKVITASAAELAKNPRARSAKLRFFERSAAAAPRETVPAMLYA